MTIAVYAGSLDPITLAHLSIIYRSNKLFDRLVVGVGVNSLKNPLFNPEERVTLINEAMEADWNAAHGSWDPHLRAGGFVEPGSVVVEIFEGLLVDFCRRQHATVIVRGLRAVSDFEQEMAIAHTNDTLAGIDTVFLPTRPGQSFVSSSMVKEIARQRSETGWRALGHYCPPNVVDALKVRFA